MTGITNGHVSRGWHIRPLVLAFGLDGLAILCFAVAQRIIMSSRPRASQASGFFADPLPAWLMVCAGTAFVAGGGVAAVVLLRDPMTCRVGSWANRIAVFNIVLLPLLGVITGIAAVVGADLPSGWAEPFAPVWLGSGLLAIGLGLSAKGDRQKGALMIPLIVGATVLAFWLGEVLSPH